jgi:hypothetical protein
MKINEQRNEEKDLEKRPNCSLIPWSNESQSGVFVQIERRRLELEASFI